MKTSFGALIKTAREAKNMSLRDLSSMSEVSYSQIAKFERGEATPRHRTIAQLAKALDIDLSEAYLSAGYVPVDNVSYIVEKSEELLDSLRQTKFEKGEEIVVNHIMPSLTKIIQTIEDTDIEKDLSYLVHSPVSIRKGDLVGAIETREALRWFLIHARNLLDRKDSSDSR